jgi:hypothetical protein
VSDCCLTPNEQCFSYHGENKLNSMKWLWWGWWWCPLLTRSTFLVGIYDANSLKQQTVGRPVVPLGHIIMIPRQTIFALTPLNLSGEVENYNFIVFGLTRKWLQTHVLCSCLYGLVSLCKSYLRLYFVRICFMYFLPLE